MLYEMETFLEALANYGILMFEYIGVLYIIKTGIVSLYMVIKRKNNKRIYLAKGLSMGLQFKLGSEILRTVLIREWTEIGIAGGIIVLRAALTLLIHWEITHKEDEE